MTKFKKLLIGSSTSLAVAGGATYYVTTNSNPQVSQSVSQQENDGSKSQAKRPLNPGSPGSYSYGVGSIFGDFSGDAEKASDIQKVFNYDVIRKTNTNNQKDFRKVNTRSFFLATNYRFLVGNSLAQLNKYSDDKKPVNDFKDAINDIYKTAYFNNPKLDKIVFPIKDHLKTINDYWDKAKPAKGVVANKEEWKASDIKGYKEANKNFLNFLYEDLFPKTLSGFDLKKFKHEWMQYFRDALNKRLSIPLNKQNWGSYNFPIANFTLEDLQSSWLKANDNYYKKTLLRR